MREEPDLLLAKYGAGSLRPAWEDRSQSGPSPLNHYPWIQAKAALDRLLVVEDGSPFDGVILEYTNPLNGGPVMSTMACYVQVLRPKQRTQAHRHSLCTIYHVIEGEGATIVDGERLEWE
jgi:gentisate 1,2-dioxygenase